MLFCSGRPDALEIYMHAYDGISLSGSECSMSGIYTSVCVLPIDIICLNSVGNCQVQVQVCEQRFK